MNQSGARMRACIHLLLLAVQFLAAARAWPAAAKQFQAGAAVVDITPTNFPVIVNAMFEERTATQAYDRLHARCLALDDGTERILIAVVDSCMLPRGLIDEAKRAASRVTGVPMDHMLVSATHTHSAPSAMGCLGSRVDAAYARYLPGRIAEGLEQAARNLVPARVGWGFLDDSEHTHCRRWIRRPDKLLTDPFGVRNVRANMHPGYENPDAIGPSGPVDPALSVLSVQTADGKPLALLANYSMHYYESPILSADYYGLFATKVAQLIGAEGGNGPFVGIMSQGTSGDQMWMDYGAPKRQIGLDAYAQEVAEVAARVYRKIQHRDWAPLAMRETKLTLGLRVPDSERLAWAQQVAAGLGDRLPHTMAEIYAKEAIYLRERPTAELVLQAIRIGELGIAAIPNEVYGITGLRIKAQSPFPLTFNVELANGSEGYIPPPEQHRLGGYTTWPARTAGLETDAEPRIVEASLRLLESVSGRKRRPLQDTHGAYAEAVLAAKPIGYWRLNEFTGPTAADATGHAAALQYQGNLAYYLDGPASGAFSGSQVNRAPHLAGGYLQSDVRVPADSATVEVWFWNGLPSDARAVTGELMSFESGHERVWLGGTNDTPGRVCLAVDGQQAAAGRTFVQPRTWNHLAFVRSARQVAVYLNGRLETSVERAGNRTASPNGGQDGREAWTVGGGAANEVNFEGKVDELAAYDRALAPEEIARHCQFAGLGAASPESEGHSQSQPASSATGMSSPPKSPADSLAVLHVKDGYAVELVAAEPLVASPVAIDWGTDGRLWVVEMADYPYGMDGKMRPGGRVRVLEDTDGDGRMDKATLFLDGLNFPNGIITWRNGVIVTAAPDILYAEDTDGDGKADKREVLFTGFREGNLQLRVNGLRWGLDNWLHCANGWSGGRPRSLKTGLEVDISGRDLRLRPDSGVIEAESGQSEFGRNRDDWGDWFGCDNSYPLFHFVLEDRYMRRNPHVAAPEAKRQLYLPANPRVYPRSAEQKRYHSFEHASHFTSACSTDFYRDDWLFPRGPDQHVFTCEPVHNLVQHLLVRDEGVSFTARRAESDQESDFLASEDQWFRPVMARTGPDGALWVVDMYRYMIEHPDWLPPEGKRELAPFYRAGENRGRVYRVVRKAPGSRTEARPMPRLDGLTPGQLVDALGSSNGWVRDKAQQLLTWRDEKAVVPALEQQVRSGANALARLHALATLDSLGALNVSSLERALRDPEPAVRRWAVKFSEPGAAKEPALLAAAAGLVSDADAKVRLQLACSLGEWGGAVAGEALARLGLDAAGDKYLTAAILSSAPPHVNALVNALVESPSSALPLFGPLLKLTLALERPDLVVRLLEIVLTPDQGEFKAAQLSAFTEFLDSLAHRHSSLADWARGDSRRAESFQRSQRVFAAARRLASEPAQAVPLRVAAMGLLGREAAQRELDLRALAATLVPNTPGEVQRAAVRALGRTADRSVPEMLLAGWSADFAEVRSAIADQLLGREDWILELLRHVEAGDVAPLELSVVHRDRLLKHGSARIRELAAKLFTAGSNPDRQRVIDEYRPALSLAGNAEHGKEIFGRVCAVCHRLEGIGREVGPNLESVRGHPPEKLLTSILDPSREVEPRYLGYHCTLGNGEVLYGLVASETGNGIEMKLVDGTTRTILRSEIESLHSSRVSLMPDGLEASLSRQDVADLLRFVRSGPGSGEPRP